jgi:hypothetical protein
MRVGKARLRYPLPSALRPRLVVLRKQLMSFSRFFVLLLLYCKPVGIIITIPKLSSDA